MRERTHRQLVGCFLVFTLAVATIETSAQTSPRQNSVRTESRFAPDKMETVLYGVGYYPESKFVHCDVGRVRFWRGH